MEDFCRVGHLFYRLKVLGEKNIEVGEQLYEDAFREQLIREKLKQSMNDTIPFYQILKAVPTGYERETTKVIIIKR